VLWTAIIASALAAPPGATALAITGGALGAGGLGVELYGLAHGSPRLFAVGLTGEIVGLPLIAGSGLWADGGRPAWPAAAAVALWGAGLGVKAVWRTTGPESLGQVSLGVFTGAYALAATQWALPPVALAPVRGGAAVVWTARR
jgi:hypothetical protein